MAIASPRYGRELPRSAGITRVRWFRISPRGWRRCGPRTSEIPWRGYGVRPSIISDGSTPTRHSSEPRRQSAARSTFRCRLRPVSEPTCHSGPGVIEATIKDVEALGLPAEETDLILSGNASRLPGVATG